MSTHLISPAFHQHLRQFVNEAEIQEYEQYLMKGKQDGTKRNNGAQSQSRPAKNVKLAGSNHTHTLADKRARSKPSARADGVSPKPASDLSRGQLRSAVSRQHPAQSLSQAARRLVKRSAQALLFIPIGFSQCYGKACYFELYGELIENNKDTNTQINLVTNDPLIVKQIEKIKKHKGHFHIVFSE